ncbi:hypothetical protein EPO15_14295 [bacterium]|nr:MAG: hypothetical protein EPO15_14295 [bacterium]
MRRLTSVVLSLILTGLSAGLAPYSAWGQVRAQAVTVGPAARGLGAAGVSPLAPSAVSFAPTLPTAISLSATLPLAPAPALRPSAAPAAAARAAVHAVAVSAFAAPVAAVAAAPAPLAQTFSPAAASLNAALPAREAAPVSAETEVSVSGKLFDGSFLRRGASEVGVGSQVAGRARPALNPALDETAEPAPEQAPAAAAAPLLEGRLDVSAYKLPWDLRARRAVALAAHYGLMAAVPVLLGVGLGLIPLAVGGAALGVRLISERVKTARANGADELTERDLRATRELLLRHKRGEVLSDAERADLETRAAPFEQLLTWAEGTVDYLTGRLGRDPQSAPRVWIDESSHDLHWAASVGGTLDKSGAIYMGIGFVLRPLERAVGVLAHEMGHLFFGDQGKFRERLRMHGGWSGGFKTGMRDALAGAGAAAAAKAVLVALSFADPSFLVWGLLWTAAAFASAAVALLAGLAATRQEELRADHFSAWLTDGSWLAAFLEDEAGRGREKRGRFGRWADHLLSTHPAWETRVERLTGYARPQALREAVLPVSDSFWGLSGETQAVVTGADASLAEALAARAQGSYDFRLYQGMDGALVVRAHPVFGARIDGSPDRAVAALLAAALADKFPGARIARVSTSLHPAVEALSGSALGRELLAELSSSPLTLRWEAGAPGAARSAFVATGPRPEVVLNSNVFWKASPKAQAAALAAELARYRAWRAKAELSDALAEGTGARVFVELKGGAADDVETPSGPLFASAFTAWARRADLSPAERAWVAAHPWPAFEARFLKR